MCTLRASLGIFFLARKILTRKWLEENKDWHLFLWRIHFAISYSHEFWISTVFFVDCHNLLHWWSWLSYFIHCPNTVSKYFEGWKAGRGDTLWHVVVAFFSLEKRVGLVSQDKEQFTKVTLCHGVDLNTNAEHLHWTTNKRTLKWLNPDLTYPRKSDYVVGTAQPHQTHRPNLHPTHWYQTIKFFDGF